VAEDDDDGLRSLAVHDVEKAREKGRFRAASERIGEERFGKPHPPGLARGEDDGSDHARDIITRMRRDSATLSEILERALPPAARHRIFSVAMVENRWAGVVGDEIARRAEPESLEGGVLTVRVTDPAWGRMLLKLQGRIVPALNRAMGQGLVRRINFVTREKLQNPAPEVRAAVIPAPLGPPPENVVAASEASEDASFARGQDSAALYCGRASMRKGIRDGLSS
jgi:hypothetical protein